MQHKPRIAGIALNALDPEGLAGFYCDVLGMSHQDFGEEIAVGYGGEGAVLILRHSQSKLPYQHRKGDRYWKIAITLPDLDAAQAQLVQKSVEASQPHQFQDIAYMSHLTDPEGHIVELIQHTFDGKPKTAKARPDIPLGGGAQLGLITLRTSDIDVELRTCQQDLGMRYLSRQPVPEFGFVLYFLGMTDQRPPEPDVNAVANREWLWQRPYTCLEFQHLPDGRVKPMAFDEGMKILIEDEANGRMWFQ